MIQYFVLLWQGNPPGGEDGAIVTDLRKKITSPPRTPNKRASPTKPFARTPNSRTCTCTPPVMPHERVNGRAIQKPQRLFFGTTIQFKGRAKTPIKPPNTPVSVSQAEVHSPGLPHLCKERTSPVSPQTGGTTPIKPQAGCTSLLKPDAGRMWSPVMAQAGCTSPVGPQVGCMSPVMLPLVPHPSKQPRASQVIGCTLLISPSSLPTTSARVTYHDSQREALWLRNRAEDIKQVATDHAIADETCR
jgi:hypothetical protein